MKRPQKQKTPQDLLDLLFATASKIVELAAATPPGQLSTLQAYAPDDESTGADLSAAAAPDGSESINQARDTIPLAEQIPQALADADPREQLPILPMPTSSATPPPPWIHEPHIEYPPEAMTDPPGPTDARPFARDRKPPEFPPEPPIECPSCGNKFEAPLRHTPRPGEPQLSNPAFYAAISIPENRIERSGTWELRRFAAHPGAPGWYHVQRLEWPDQRRAFDHERAKILPPEQQPQPTEHQKRPYATKGKADLLAWFHDSIERQFGAHQILAFWQYLDRRSRGETFPGMKRDTGGLPKLTIKNAARYIAAVALLVAQKKIDKDSANALLYAAQLLVSAQKLLPESQTRPKRKSISAAKSPLLLGAPTKEL